MEVIKEYTICSEQGWHARPCALITRTIVGHPSVWVELFHPRSKRTTDGKSLFELMLFGANKGDKVIIKLKSEDKEEIDDLIKTLDRLIPGFYDSE